MVTDASIVSLPAWQGRNKKPAQNVLLLSKWIGLKLGGDMRDLIPGIQVEEKYQRTAGKLASLTSAAHTSKLNLENADALALGLATLQLTLLGLLARWVRKHPVSKRDIAITRALQQKDSHLLDYAALAFTFISNPKIMMPMMVPVALIFWKMHLRLAAAMLAVLTLVNEVTKLWIKRIVGRPRPNPALVHVYKSAHGQSFPSGNAASAVTFWGWLLAMGLLHLKGRARKILLLIPALIIILIGPSRVYLGDHWASDVLGGYLLGSSWLALALRAYLKLREQSNASYK
jgi:membrane-associated phospholipid phosphatase